MSKGKWSSLHDARCDLPLCPVVSLSLADIDSAQYDLQSTFIKTKAHPNDTTHGSTLSSGTRRSRNTLEHHEIHRKVICQDRFRLITNPQPRSRGFFLHGFYPVSFSHIFPAISHLIILMNSFPRCLISVTSALHRKWIILAGLWRRFAAGVALNQSTLVTLIRYVWQAPAMMKSYSRRTSSNPCSC